MFNLPPPQNFRGLNPYLPVTVYTRNLPHWRQDGATYFSTFRLRDSLPQKQLAYLKRLKIEWERTHPPPRSEADQEDHARRIVNLVERWSDAGYGACWFRGPQWVNELTERMFHFQTEQYQLHCFVIMPNHCHLIMRPLAGYELEDILQAIKSMVA